MKKTLLTLAVAATFFAANAQIKNDKGTFDKPVAGSFAIETLYSFRTDGGTPFSLNNDVFLSNLNSGLNRDAVRTNTGTQSPNLNFPSATGGLLKGRYFLSEGLAVRAQLGLNIASINSSSDVTVGSNTTTTKLRNSNNAFNLALGIEKHFSGAERLSTYAGADLLFGLASYKGKNDNGTTTFESKQSGTGFGLRGVTGFDYYFIPKVYIGAELGLGFGVSSYGVVKASGGTLKDGTTKTSALSVNPFIQPAFRLGFRF